MTDFEFEETIRWVREAAAEPPAEAIARSRRRATDWFEGSAPPLHWTRLPTPIGSLHLAANERGLVRITFSEETEGFLGSLDPKARLVAGGDALEGHCRQLEQYFAGQRREFGLPTDLSTATDFQRQVLTAIGEIPPGEVRTYGQIAEAVGKPNAARAVGQALASNPIPIVLPCHRVLASDGTLGGYAGGLARKRRLLQLEGAALPGAR